MHYLAYTPVFIFSVYRGEDETLDRYSSMLLPIRLSHDHGIVLKNVTGSYNSVIEQSFVINAKHWEIVLDLAEEYGQEKLLFVDGNRESFLVDVATGEVVPQGEFKRVTEHAAMQHGSWTKDEFGQYWASTGEVGYVGTN